MDNCMSSMIKYLLFATNFLVFAMGLVCMGFGVYVYVDPDGLTDILQHADVDVDITVFTTAALIVIIASVVVVLISFFGCCGAIKENKCMLGIYIVFLLILFGFMIAGAVLGVSQGIEEIKDAFESSLKQYKANATEDGDKDEWELKDAWDSLQVEFKCCGVNNHTDWVTLNPFYPMGTGQNTKYVPDSCCKEHGNVTTDAQVEACVKNPDGYQGALPGCWTEFKDIIEDHETEILIVGLTIVGLMILNLVFSCATFCAIHKGYNV